MSKKTKIKIHKFRTIAEFGIVGFIMYALMNSDVYLQLVLEVIGSNAVDPTTKSLTDTGVLINGIIYGGILVLLAYALLQ